jgi:hypothetical protein
VVIRSVATAGTSTGGAPRDRGATYRGATYRGATLRAASGADLARSTSADLEVAWGHREALVLAAGVLVRAAGHGPVDATCTAVACPLVLRTGDTLLCGVADRLAAGAVLAPASAVVSLDAALATFTGALVTAADAIRCCRQTAHSSAACWFQPPSGGDGCGEVLRLLHRLG